MGKGEKLFLRPEIWIEEERKRNWIMVDQQETGGATEANKKEIAQTDRGVKSTVRKRWPARFPILQFQFLNAFPLLRNQICNFLELFNLRVPSSSARVEILSVSSDWIPPRLICRLPQFISSWASQTTQNSIAKSSILGRKPKKWETGKKARFGSARCFSHDKKRGWKKKILSRGKGSGSSYISDFNFHF